MPQPTDTPTQDPSSLAAQKHEFFQRLRTALTTQDDPALRRLIQEAIEAHDYDSAHRAASSISTEPDRTYALHTVAVCAAAAKLPRAARQAALAIDREDDVQAAIDAIQQVETTGATPTEC